LLARPTSRRTAPRRAAPRRAARWCPGAPLRALIIHPTSTSRLGKRTLGGNEGARRRGLLPLPRILTRISGCISGRRDVRFATFPSRCEDACDEGAGCTARIRVAVSHPGHYASASDVATRTTDIRIVHDVDVDVQSWMLRAGLHGSAVYNQKLTSDDVRCRALAGRAGYLRNTSGDGRLALCERGTAHGATVTCWGSLDRVATDIISSGGL